jgi:2',3'-cyclic-nucleotide 2'-phosphodiesterase (5'-nucleotidase family)
VLKELRESTPTVVVDGGDLFWKSRLIRDRDLAQRQLKAQTQAKLLTQQGMDAMVPGEGDLALGIAEYVALTQDMPVLAGNLVCGEQTWPLTRVVKAGGQKVGVIGVTGEIHPDCTLSQDPVDAVKTGVAQLGSGVDVILVIGHVGHSFADNAGAVPRVDFVLEGESGSARRNPIRKDEGAWQLGSGKRGKTLGVLTLSFVSGATGWMDQASAVGIQERLDQRSQRLEEAIDGLASADEEDRGKYQARIDYFTQEVADAEADLAASKASDGALSHLFLNKLVELETSIGEDPEVLAALEALTQAVAELPGQVASTPPRIGPYVGSESCRGCHMEAYAQWSTTPHSKAYLSLEKASKQLDNSCFGCHVTGAFHPEGPHYANEVGHLKNVGCESCHGPGKEHVAGPKAGQMTSEPREASCVQCHDGIQDNGDFDLEAYWPKVVHGAAQVP